MNSQEFGEFGKAAIDYIVELNEGLRERDVLPSVEPGYLSKLVPEEAPVKAETWQDVLKDVERVIMPGVSGLPISSLSSYYIIVRDFVL